MNKYIKSKTIVNISNLDNDKLDIQEAFEVLKDVQILIIILLMKIL